ncbi:hypothetical protein HDV03_004953 [Kappamyces sp. JEL0829]|nr:hypothetical protein HDV03_004953 [Kappamyces sp. JEL0829]
MNRKITPRDISQPKMLFTTNDAKKSMDSAVDLKRSSQQSFDSLQQPPIIPFAVGRHDVSVSVVGGPADPRRLEDNSPKELSLEQYQSFAEAVRAYRMQIEKMATATETFVRHLQELADCVPQAPIRDPKLVADLDFMIDSSQLLGNTHQNWSLLLEREIEAPIFADLRQLPKIAKAKQDANLLKVKALEHQLQAEEDFAYRMKKKRIHDVSIQQRSLANRISLKEEINRLHRQNESVVDALAHDRVPHLLQLVSRAVAAQLDTVETITEGVQKMGRSVVVDSPPAHEPEPNGLSGNAQTVVMSSKSLDHIRSRRGYPVDDDDSQTEILLKSPDKEFNMAFLEKMMANF